MTKWESTFHECAKRKTSKLGLGLDIIPRAPVVFSNGKSRTSITRVLYYLGYQTQLVNLINENNLKTKMNEYDFEIKV